jgi:hypothetical protein
MKALYFHEKAICSGEFIVFRSVEVYDKSLTQATY